MHTYLETTTRNTLDSSDVASVVTDADGVIHLLNDAAKQLLGLESEHWQGRTLHELLQGASLRDAVADICEGVLVKELVLGFDRGSQSLSLCVSNHPLHRGSDCVGIIWTLRSLAQCREDGAGGLSQLQRYKKLFESTVVPQVVLDITACYSWICAHRVSSVEVLQQLLDEQPGLCFELAGSVRLVEANAAALALFDSSSAAKLNERIAGNTEQAEVLQMASIAMAVYAGEDSCEFPVKGRASNAALQLQAICTLPGASELDEGVLVSLLDLSDLIDTRADLDTRDRFLSAALQAVPDLLLVYDFDADRPLLANDTLRQQLGYDWEDIENLGGEFSDRVMHPDNVMAESDRAHFLARLANGEVVEQTLRLRDIDDNWRQFQARTASLEVCEGRTRVGVIVARDVTEQLQAKGQAQRHQRRYKLLADNFSDVICTTDVKLRVTFLSPSVERVLGYNQAELPDLEQAMLLENQALADMRTALLKDIAAAKRERRQPQLSALDYARVFDIELSHKDGFAVFLEVQCSLMWDEAGDLQGLLLVCRDVTQRTQMEADRRLAAKVFENSLEGIYITGADGCISQINRAFTELTGYALSNVLGQRPSILAAKSRPVSFAKVIKPILESMGYWQGELWSRRKDGSEFPTAIGITAVRGKQGESLGYITTFKDITERRNTEDRIRKLAYYDPLTGLPNRTLFVDRLNQELQAALRANSHVALLFLDMDRFKSVNDSMGHASGDLLLGKIAEKLSSCVRGNDSMARMGGDEFTIILSGLKDRAKAVSAAVSVAHKIKDVLDEPLVLHGREVFLSASIGIAVYPEDGDDATTLLKHADVAMYNAKQAGSNNFQFYVDAMNAQALEKLELQNGLYRAAVNHDFRAMYQPIVDLSTGKVRAVETLLRWNHPVRGPISPTEFVPVAEESGLIVRIGQWVLQEACQQMAVWLSEGHQLEWIAVNISARQFAEGNLVRLVNNALDESALPANYLELELTESILIDDIAYTLEALHDLKSMGIELAIDDFGTGYSSLSYLKQFPIDRLKIDRAFVTGLAEDVEDQRITQAILAIARSFNLAVVAEGVEDQAQLDFLTAQGCDSGQGYLFGQPMSATELSELLRKQSAVALDSPAD